MDRDHELIFSGDTFGISYRDFDVDGRAFIFPTTTPVHFDPEALCASVDRLMSYRPQLDLPHALRRGARTCSGSRAR